MSYTDEQLDTTRGAAADDVPMSTRLRAVDRQAVRALAAQHDTSVAHILRVIIAAAVRGDHVTTSSGRLLIRRRAR